MNKGCKTRSSTRYVGKGFLIDIFFRFLIIKAKIRKKISRAWRAV